MCVCVCVCVFVFATFMLVNETDTKHLWANIEPHFKSAMNHLFLPQVHSHQGYIELYHIELEAFLMFCDINREQS